MRLPNSIIIIVISLFSFAACANSHKSDGVTSEKEGSKNDFLTDKSEQGWKNLDDSLYTLQYPENWEMNYTGQVGLSFVVVSPAEDDADMFRENISLATQSMLKDDSTLDDFVADYTAQILDMVQDSKLIKNEKSKLGDQVYREVVYSGTQNGLEIINTQRYFFHGSLVFVLTYTCQQGKQDIFNPIAKKLMDSIKVK